MKVLFVGLDAATAAHCMRQVGALGLAAEHAADPRRALEILGRGDCRAVGIALTPTPDSAAPPPSAAPPLLAAPSCWSVVEAAASMDEPARVVALVKGPIDPALRRRAYGAGVWELLEAGRDARRAMFLMDGIRRALAHAIEPMVLLVDQCSRFTDDLAALIAGYGFRVETAATAAEAIRLMSARDYVLVVTETLRAGIETRRPEPEGRDADSFAVLKAAQGLQPGVPVVVLTAAAFDEVLLRAIELGARDCLWKLMEPERILEALHSALLPAGIDRTRTLSEDP